MTVWTSYQGVEVVESDSTVRYRHPRLAGGDDTRLNPLEGATLLALVDGTFLVVCDVDGCKFNGITGNLPYVKPEGDQRPIVDQATSLFSHINSAHRTDRTVSRPMYSDDLIKVAIKVYLKWKATKIRNWSNSAAAELEQMGFRPRFSEHWTGNIVVSLANRYMKEPKFKNIKAGPMDDNERAALAEMIRQAAEREGHGRKTAVAANVRITETKKPPHKHTPIDFAKIIADKDAAPEQQEETAVVTGDNPTLNFVGHGGGAPLETPVRTLDMNTDAHVVKPATRGKAQPHVVIPQQSDFELVIELPDGEPLFKYKGKLMVGKLAKVMVEA